MDWPKCEYNLSDDLEGGIGIVCHEGRLRFYPSPNAMGTELGICPACNGTGERDLTADEAAEYLWGNNCNWHPEKCPTEAVQAGQVKSVMVTVHRYDGKEWKLFGFYEGDGLTAALNAACRAVRSKG